MNPETILLENLHHIDRISAAVGRRALLQPADLADFNAWVKSRFIDDNYAILRKFQGRSSITTYLTVVITNLMRDFRIQRWGRWRPSVEAKRLGPVGVQLETLIHRDGYSVREAIQRIRSVGGESPTERELLQWAQRFPARRRPREVGDASLELQKSSAAADDRIILSEQTEEWDTTRSYLNEAMNGLSDEDQLILRMRFWEGHSVADISRTLGLEQKPLYRRIDRLLGQLKISLETSGLHRDRVVALLAEGSE